MGKDGFKERVLLPLGLVVAIMLYVLAGSALVEWVVPTPAGMENVR